MFLRQHSEPDKRYNLRTKLTVTAYMRKPSQPNYKPSICFVALNAYNVLSGRKDIKHIGGAEVQQVRIASWLVGRGYSVSFVTLDHGQPDGINLNGITVRKAYSAEAGIRGLRFVHPRWSHLWAAMSRANADLYYQRGVGVETGQVALWCYLHRRRFILAAAALTNCDPQLLARWKPLKERLFYRTGVRLAHGIIAQTATQQELFRRNMGLSTVLVRNCGWDMNNSASHEPLSIPNHDSMRVLWVGQISKVKRFEWLLDVAEQCPEIVFDVVCAANTDSYYASALINRADTISNVTMNGRVPYAEMAGYYRHCHVLCCTSAHEGFPNTFLEAWALGIPVVSTIDPDNLIVSNGLGLVAHDVKGIVTCLRKITQSSETWLKASRAAKQYYLANHTPEVCLPIFEHLLLKVVGHQRT